MSKGDNPFGVSTTDIVHGCISRKSPDTRRESRHRIVPAHTLTHCHTRTCIQCVREWRHVTIHTVACISVIQTHTHTHRYSLDNVRVCRVGNFNIGML